MKKVMIIGQVLFFGLSYQASAKAGIADGGLKFALVIIGFLLLVTGLLEGIEYLRKNGKDLFKRFWTFLRKQMLTLRNSH